MAKYGGKLKELRVKSRELIPELLTTSSKGTNQIFTEIRKKVPDLCDDKIICQCGRKPKKTPEWQHQIRWAIQDLKLKKVIARDIENKVYKIN